MAITKLEIYEGTLALLGLSRLGALGTDKEEEQAINQLYDICRVCLLEEYDWNFSVEIAELTANLVNENPQYTYAYAKPSNCIRMIKAYDSTSVIEEIGQNVYTNDDALTLYYVKDITDATLFNPLFAKVLMLDIAMLIETKVGNEQATLYKKFAAERERLLKVAKKIDSLKNNRQTTMLSNIDGSRYNPYGE